MDGDFPNSSLDCFLESLALRVVDQIDLVEDDEIRFGQLLCEEILHRFGEGACRGSQKTSYPRRLDQDRKRRKVEKRSIVFAQRLVYGGGKVRATTHRLR